MQIECNWRGPRMRWGAYISHSTIVVWSHAHTRLFHVTYEKFSIGYHRKHQVQKYLVKPVVTAISVLDSKLSTTMKQWHLGEPVRGGRWRIVLHTQTLRCCKYFDSSCFVFYCWFCFGGFINWERIEKQRSINHPWDEIDSDERQSP